MNTFHEDKAKSVAQALSVLKHLPSFNLERALEDLCRPLGVKPPKTAPSVTVVEPSVYLNYTLPAVSYEKALTIDIARPQFDGLSVWTNKTFPVGHGRLSVRLSMEPVPYPPDVDQLLISIGVKRIELEPYKREVLLCHI